MNDTDGPLDTFLEGLEEELKSSADDSQPVAWGPVLRPNEAPEKADPAPESFNQPVWSRSYGWIDRSELHHEVLVWTDPSEIE